MPLSNALVNLPPITMAKRRMICKAPHSLDAEVMSQLQDRPQELPRINCRIFPGIRSGFFPDDREDQVPSTVSEVSSTICENLSEHETADEGYLFLSGKGLPDHQRNEMRQMGHPRLGVPWGRAPIPPIPKEGPAKKQRTVWP